MTQQSRADCLSRAAGSIGNQCLNPSIPLPPFPPLSSPPPLTPHTRAHAHPRHTMSPPAAANGAGGSTGHLHSCVDDSRNMGQHLASRLLQIG